MDNSEKICGEESVFDKEASQKLPKAVAVDFDIVDRFCGKITALFLPYLNENISEKEWMRFHGKIEACFREFADVNC